MSSKERFIHRIVVSGPVGTKCLWNKKVRDISYEFTDI